MQISSVSSFLKSDLRRLVFVGAFLSVVIIGLSTDILNAQSSKQNQDLEWLDAVGSGLVAPACNSAYPVSSCEADGDAQVRLSWGYDDHGSSGYLQYDGCSATVTFGSQTLTGQSCTTAYTFGNLNSNTNYPFTVDFNTSGWCGEWGGWIYYCSNTETLSNSIITPSCQPLPNLQGQATGISGSAISGQLLTFNGNVLNPSSAGASLAADGTFANRFQYKLTSSSDWNTAASVDTAAEAHNIAVDSSEAANVTFTLPPNTLPGTYDLRLCADTTGGVQEVNENDNCGPAVQFTVSEPPMTNAACAAAPSSQVVNGLVTWSATAEGGITPYSCTWSGDVSGSGCSIQTSYGSGGTKTANVTITSASGKLSQPAQCQVDIHAPQCSDGIDNGDPDTLKDGDDPGCWSDMGNPGSYNPNDDDESGPPPNLSIDASPRLISQNGTSQVTWSATNVQSCAVTGGGSSWTGTSGSRTTNPLSQTTTYTLSCLDGDDQTQTASVVIRINPSYIEE